MIGKFTNAFYGVINAVAGTSPPTEAELHSENAEIQRRIDIIEQQLDRFKSYSQMAASKIEKYSHDTVRWDAETTRIKAELSAERQRQTELNEEQEMEIESLKVFLDMHDQADPSSLLSQLADINDMVEQLALELSCKWELPEQRPGHVDSKIKHRVTSAIGETLFDVLGSCSLTDDGTPSLFQYALQAAVLSPVFELFHVWYTGNTQGDLLQKLTQKVQEGEIQPIYGRWRCVTRRYMRAARGPNYDTQALARHLNGTLDNVCSVAVILGLPLASKDWEELRGEFEMPINEIGKKVIRLATSVTEDVVSRDYDLYAPETGVEFDMEDMETPTPLPNISETSDTVVCAISLGLKSTGKPGRERTKPQQQLLKKSVVLTKLGLLELISPPESRMEECTRSEISGMGGHHGGVPNTTSGYCVEDQQTPRSASPLESGIRSSRHEAMQTTSATLC